MSLGRDHQDSIPSCVNGPATPPAETPPGASPAGGGARGAPRSQTPPAAQTQAGSARFRLPGLRAGGRAKRRAAPGERTIVQQLPRAGSGRAATAGPLRR